MPLPRPLALSLRSFGKLAWSMRCDQGVMGMKSVRSALSVFLAATLAFAMVPAAGFAYADDFSNRPSASAVVAGAPDDYSSEGIIVVKKDRSWDASALSAGEDAGFADSLEAGCEAVGSAEMITDDAALVKVPSSEDAYDTAQEIASRDDVVYVQPNYMYVLPEEETGAASSADVLAVPDDPDLFQQWYLDTVGLTRAWDRVQTEGTVSIAVLDSQCNIVHEDLKGNIDVADSYNAMPADFDQVTGTAKEHGTRVASILGAVCGNGLGVSGGSYNANVIPVNVFGSDNGRKATTATIAQGLEHVLDLAEAKPELNIRVINMSLGGYGALSESGSDQLLYNLVQETVLERGIAVVAAGGNGNASTFLWPSDWDNVISVTALNRDGQTRAWFSDYNEHKDIAAPGVDMLTADASGTSSYSKDDGTSFAAPLVSATLALMFAANPDLTVARATEILYDTAVDIGSTGVDEEFGHGRLNADAAVAQALLENPKASLRYQDVDQGAWYQTPIGYLDFAVSRGILMGQGSLLRPEDSLTRSEAAVVLWRVFDPTEAASYRQVDAISQVPFRDVYSYQWYTGALNWAYENDVTHGYENGLFGGDDPVNVEQFCTFMANCLAEESAVAAADTSRLDGYVDQESVSPYARQSVAWCLNEGIINGFSTDSGMALAPQELLTRARLAGLVYNAYAVNDGNLVFAGL